MKIEDMNIKVNVDTKAIDVAIEKAKLLNALLYGNSIDYEVLSIENHERFLTAGESLEFLKKLQKKYHH